MRTQLEVRETLRSLIRAYLSPATLLDGAETARRERCRSVPSPAPWSDLRVRRYSDQSEPPSPGDNGPCLPDRRRWTPSDSGRRSTPELAQHLLNTLISVRMVPPDLEWTLDLPNRQFRGCIWIQTGPRNHASYYQEVRGSNPFGRTEEKAPNCSDAVQGFFVV